MVETDVVMCMGGYHPCEVRSEQLRKVSGWASTFVTDAYNRHALHLISLSLLRIIYGRHLVQRTTFAAELYPL